MHKSKMSGNSIFISLLLFYCMTPGISAEDVCETGTAQSPIDIISDDAKGCGYDPLVLTYATNGTVQISNTGKTVQIDIDAAGGPFTAEGGPLKEEYTLKMVQFHWGGSDTEGSEHTVDGKKYAMEAHAIHYKTGSGSYDSAAGSSGGLAIVAFLFEAGGDNADLKPLIDVVSQLGAGGGAAEAPEEGGEEAPPEERAEAPAEGETPAAGRQARNQPLGSKEALDWMVQAAEGAEYFSYDGSLTSSPCSEGVFWMVFKSPLNISAEQILAFRNTGAGPNFRNTYPQGDRKICIGASSRLTAYAGLLFIPVILLCFEKYSFLP